MQAVIFFHRVAGDSFRLTASVIREMLRSGPLFLSIERKKSYEVVPVFLGRCSCLMQLGGCLGEGPGERLYLDGWMDG